MLTAECCASGDIRAARQLAVEVAGWDARPVTSVGCMLAARNVADSSLWICWRWQVLALGISRTNASVMNIQSGMHLLQTMTRILRREPFLLVLDAAAYDYICNDMSS